MLDDVELYLSLKFQEGYQRHQAALRLAAARKLESERRSAQELEIAKQVQARLFPQTLPLLRTLEYAGICIQAREVGGDYYDFLDLGRSRLGLVIGDISGKGITIGLGSPIAIPIPTAQDLAPILGAETR